MNKKNSIHKPLIGIIKSNLISFLIVLFLMIISAAVQSTAVFSFIPLVDILLNQDPANQSGVTRFFGNIFIEFGLMGWICIGFALLNTLYKSQIHRFFDFF